MNRKSESRKKLPPINRFLLKGFRRYSRRLIRKHFHSVAFESACLNSLGDDDPSQPLIVYGNHPGWWDPLTANYVCESCFPGRDFYAPIDAAALGQYRVLGKLGFYGIDLSSTAGAAAFLSASRAITEVPGTSIWLTPEGRFCDVRDRSAELMPGLAHLASKLTHGRVIPMAIEYVFWEERLPEMLLRFGDAISIADNASKDKHAWGHLVTEGLRRAQDQLSELAIARDIDRFTVTMRGGKGSGLMYDISRRARAFFSGTQFKATHGEKLH